MALIYRAQQSALESKDGKKKWFPRIIKIDESASTDEMSEEIAFSSSLTPGDVKNVIENLLTVMRRHLLNSRSVKLEKLGTFTVSARSTGNGVDKEEDVSSTQINGLRILFTPAYTYSKAEGTTRAMFTNVRFRKWDGKVSSASGTDDGEEDDFIDPTT